jgi:processive 1,2-diacylglycerol beta-glucosyltransferase
MREKPDQIVTVYHMHLNPLLEVAKEMGIPVLHLATDFDCKAREVFVDEKGTDYEHFKFSGWVDISEIRDSMHPLSEEQRAISGFCVRREFLTETDESVLKKMREKRHLDPDTKVVLLMGGGGGQRVPFPSKLARSETCNDKLHVVVIAGANKEFGLEIEALKAKNPNITFEVAKGGDPKNPYFIGPQALNEFMDLADVIVTKAGGVSIAEAMQKGLPILFDHRIETFLWEEYNIATVKHLRRGFSANKVKNFVEDLRRTIALGKTSFDQVDPSRVVPKLVEQMQEKAAGDKNFSARRAQNER